MQTTSSVIRNVHWGLVSLKTNGERGLSDNNCHDCKYLRAGQGSNSFITDHSTLMVRVTLQIQKILEFQIFFRHDVQNSYTCVGSAFSYMYRPALFT
jgi:hypothetical protein